VAEAALGSQPGSSISAPDRLIACVPSVCVGKAGATELGPPHPAVTMRAADAANGKKKLPLERIENHPFILK